MKAGSVSLTRQDNLREAESERIWRVHEALKALLFDAQ